MMKQPVTVLASFKLAAGSTEADLLAASDRFQEVFVSKQPGVLRRELIRTGDREYTDIVRFRSQQDAEKVLEDEANSPDCQALFSVMDMSDMDEKMEFYVSLATYEQVQT